ncbi:MAG: Ig-like domain-containing protein, partial [Bacteroidales bacterium]
MLLKSKANSASYFFKFLAGVITFITFLFSCAKQVPLTGGPKDTEPPKLVYASPYIGSTNFSQQKVILKFDEFIKLNSLNQKLIISPPINPEPKINLSGKSIKILFEPNSLSENTTYLINFNDAIADVNENNAINSFIYAFSTGNVIDSLMISGKAVDALSQKPADDIWILLHINLSDTAITSLKPDYITKTDRNGNFTVPFLKQNQYRLYALKDINFNYIYDLPNEMIAFHDSIITPTAVFDTVSKKVIFQPSNIILRLFSSEKQLQSVKSSKRTYRNKIELVF